MPRQILLLISFVISFQVSNAQFQVRGKVISSSNEPVAGASISVKGTYYGATSAADGSFSFQVSDSGRQQVLVTIMGYKDQIHDLEIHQPISTINFQLKQEITEMSAVVITAGSFEASDKKRATVLKSIDVVTTAGQQADIVAALKTLPGAQQVGEQEGLFVRGGTGAETKVFIDGMLVTNPFFSSVPGISQRGRFSPLLFKGTVFSSGGYSAQYGQALSSALILESIDLPSRSEVNMIISSAQMSFMGQNLNKAKNSSAGININYSNLAPYFTIVKQKYQYTKAPEAINVEFNFRRKFKNGMLKFYGYANNNEVGFSRPNLDVSGFNEIFFIKNKNVFTNLTYTQKFQDDWSLYAGASVSINDDKISILTGNGDTTIFSFFPHLTNRTSQAKAMLTKTFPGLSKLYIGTEYQNISDGITAKDSIVKRTINDNYISAFIESDIYYSANIVSKVGVRYEYSSLLNKAAISPRISIAYKLNGSSQLSFAYGSFSQKPETNFLLRNSSLDLTKATHYILNFQRTRNGNTLRLEAFHKNYKKLVTTIKGDPSTISNEGSGYAKGFEGFWRDKTTIKNLDYWISYSYLDTKRKYLDYPSLANPSFAAKHTVNIVAKRYVNSISTYFSATYSYASGRPYFNPNRSEKDFMTDKTMSYHSLGLQLNYLRTIKNINAVFILNVSNALGSKQVFSYRYATKMNAQNEYSSEAITPMAKRFVFVGMYLSIGSDKRKNILD